MILHGTEAGQGPAVVLLHGLFGSAPNLGVLARRLAATRRVVSLDLRNHGASPHAAGMSYPEMAADVAETLDSRGIGAAAVVGHSMGGKVAMALALGHGARVERLLVSDIAPQRYPPHFRDIAAAMAAIPLRPGLLRAEADAFLRDAAPDPSVRGFLLQNLRFGPQPAWRIGLAEIRDALPAIEGWDVTGAYPGPVLAVRGERSDYVNDEGRAALRSVFPQARVLTVRHAGHWLHADQPEAFATVVEGFLAR